MWKQRRDSAKGAGLSADLVCLFVSSVAGAVAVVGALVNLFVPDAVPVEGFLALAVFYGALSAANAFTRSRTRRIAAVGRRRPLGGTPTTDPALECERASPSVRRKLTRTASEE